MLYPGEKEYQDAVNATARVGGAVGSDPVVPRWVRKFLHKARKPQKVLDLGAGPTASHANLLQEQYPDHEIEAYEIGRNYNPEVHTPVVEANTYDLVYMSNVVNVQPSWEKVSTILQCGRILLKQFGYLVFNYPDSPRKAGLSVKGFEELLDLIFGDDWSKNTKFSSTPIYITWRRD